MAKKKRPTPPEKQPETIAGMSAEELEEAREYDRQSRSLMLADMFLDLVVLSVLAFVVARPLDAWLRQFESLGADSRWGDTLRLLAIYGYCLALHVAISLPLSFYRGYIFEHQAGMSNQTIARWASQYIKGLLLLAILNSLLLAGLFWMIWLVGPWWWVPAAIMGFLVSVVGGWVFPVVILPLFYETEPLDDEELLGKLRHLAEDAGLTIEGLYRLVLSADTKKANAALAGLGKTRRVLLADTLLENFTHDEIKVVMAHEMGHHVYRHIWIGTLMAFPFCLVLFWLCNQALALSVGYGYSPHHLPVHMLPLIQLLTLVIGIVSGPLANAVTRYFERQCDWYALHKTKLADAYKSAFTKLAKQNKADPNPGRLEVILFEDHPPIAERLKMADQYAQK